MDFQFELAKPTDDAALRQLLATTPMPGSLTVTFEREPSYFLGCGTMGPVSQVAVAYPPAGSTPTGGELAGVLCRAVMPRFVNGAELPVGYIGQLRVAEGYRGRWLLSQGLAFVRALHADGQTPFYLAAISDDNRVARGVLVERPRPGFPTLREAARLHTLGVIVRRPLPPLRCAAELQRGTPEMVGEIVAFLRAHGAARQFFPAYTPADFAPGARTTLGFDVGDFIIARRQGDIVGMSGLWDQSSYKQSVVQAYHGPLRWARPLYNAGARLMGAQPLPAPGAHIHAAYASFICVTDDAPEIFGAVLRGVYNLAAERRYAHLMLGLAERDPLLPVARRYPHITYYSSLYTVAWEADAVPPLDERVPYIEIAAL